MLGRLTAIFFVSEEDLFYLKLLLMYLTVKAQLYSSRLFL